MNLTSVDAIRITHDLIGRGVLLKQHLDFIKKDIGVDRIVKPILHSNQYFHLLKWLKKKGALGGEELAKASEILEEEPYSGI